MIVQVKDAVGWMPLPSIEEIQDSDGWQFVGQLIKHLSKFGYNVGVAYVVGDRDITFALYNESGKLGEVSVKLIEIVDFYGHISEFASSIVDKLREESHDTNRVQFD